MMLYGDATKVRDKALMLEPLPRRCIVSGAIRRRAGSTVRDPVVVGRPEPGSQGESNMKSTLKRVRILMAGMFIAGYISLLMDSRAAFWAITIALAGYLVNQPD